MRSTDAEMVVRYNLLVSVYQAMCGYNEDIYHIYPLALNPEQMKKDIEADFSPDLSWLKI